MTADEKDRVIQRLIQTKEPDLTKETAHGKAAGNRWAASEATYAQLTMLDKNKEWLTHSYNASEDNPAIVLSRTFFMAIEPEANQSDAVAFWENVRGTRSSRATSDDYVLGFADGALHIWAQVADEVTNTND